MSRPRLLVYGSLLLASVLALGVSLARRTPFEANLLRLQGTTYVLDGGTVRNQFDLHLVNKNPTESTFSLRVDSPVEASVVVRHLTQALRAFPPGGPAGFSRRLSARSVDRSTGQVLPSERYFSGYRLFLAPDLLGWSGAAPQGVPGACSPGCGGHT